MVGLRPWSGIFSPPITAGTPMFKHFRSLFTVAAGFSVFAPPALSQAVITDRHRADANRLIDAALGDSTAYTRLAAMTDTFGHRLSGSQSLEAAISWILEQMRADGLANVRGEPVMVPHWVRGEESAAGVTARAGASHARLRDERGHAAGWNHRS